MESLCFYWALRNNCCFNLLFSLHFENFGVMSVKITRNLGLNLCVFVLEAVEE